VLNKNRRRVKIAASRCAVGESLGPSRMWRASEALKRNQASASATSLRYFIDMPGIFVFIMSIYFALFRIQRISLLKKPYKGVDLRAPTYVCEGRRQHRGIVLQAWVNAHLRVPAYVDYVPWSLLVCLKCPPGKPFEYPPACRGDPRLTIPSSSPHTRVPTSLSYCCSRLPLDRQIVFPLSSVPVWGRASCPPARARSFSTRAAPPLSLSPNNPPALCRRRCYFCRCCCCCVT
jgi:hypothetical protein